MTPSDHDPMPTSVDLEAVRRGRAAQLRDRARRLERMADGLDFAERPDEVKDLYYAAAMCETRADDYEAGRSMS